MQTHLTANRQGRLSREQYRELVMEPLTIALLLLPALILLRGRIPLLGGWLFGLGVCGWLGLWMVWRALRYRTVRVQRLILRAEKSARWWRGAALYTDSGETERFARSLAPRLALERGRVYEVYYFVASGRRILLSVVEHDPLA
jgi:hypothetical protein